MSEQPIENSFGPGSPLGKMMDSEVKILLIGTGFDSCTALHYAEFVQENRTTSPQGAAVMKDGQRQWVEFACVDMDSERFPELAKAYPGDIQTGMLGQAEVKLVRMRPLVEFGIDWLKANPAPIEEGQ